jgi:hypothetical protein
MDYKGELTPLERRLVEYAASGDELDCAPKGATTAEFNQIDDWEERKIRAEVLIALCTGEVSDWSVHPRRGLRLRGAYIPGQVDLTRAQMNECPLAFHTCRFEEELVLYQATTSELSFTSCVLPSLYANELDSGASLDLTRTHLRRISLLRADFRGVVGLSEVSLSYPQRRALNAERMRASGVFLTDTRVKGEVRLLGANIGGQLSCKGGTRLINPEGKALNANGISVSSVSLSDTHVEGVATFVGANIGGQFDCDEGTELVNRRGYALDAARMSARDVFLKGTHAEGQVRFVGANIDGHLNCIKGTKLINPERYALNADGISASRVQLGASHVEGEVSFLGADIGSQLNCVEGTELINPNGTALNADSISASSVQLRAIHVKGEATFVGANIGSQLNCSGGTELINPGGHALMADSCRVGGSLFFSLGETSVGSVNLAYAQIGTLAFSLGEASVGSVNLAYAQIGTLADNLASWPDTYNLVGFTYNSLSGDQDDQRSRDRRLAWVGKSKPFSPQVYTQLAEVYRSSGHEGFARQVAIRREQLRGRQPDLSWGAKVWNRFLDFTVRYGYRPWRALVPLVVFFLAGWFLFALPPAQEVMVHPTSNIKGPISATACHEVYPCFSPPIYVLDTLLPIIDLHQESNWVPARSRPGGVWYEALTLWLIAWGWILTTAVVAGIGSLWRRE